MKIEEVKQAGVFVHVKVNGAWHCFPPNVTEEMIKEHCTRPPADTENFNKIKALEGKEI